MVLVLPEATVRPAPFDPPLHFVFVIKKRILDFFSLVRSYCCPIFSAHCLFVNLGSHCRRCGACCCNNCTSRRVAIPGGSSSKPERVCAFCFSFLMQDKISRMRSLSRGEDEREVSRYPDWMERENDFLKQNQKRVQAAFSCVIVCSITSIRVSLRIRLGDYLGSRRRGASERAAAHAAKACDSRIARRRRQRQRSVRAVVPFLPLRRFEPTGLGACSRGNSSPSLPSP